MLPTGFPNAPIGSPVFLEDLAESNRSDLEGGIGIREGE